MNKPHKWAKEICHLVNGGNVECRYINMPGETEWKLINLTNNNTIMLGIMPSNPNLEFRIPPTKKDPATVLREAWYKNMHLGTNSPDNLFRWEVAASALIKAYKNNELDESNL